MKNICLQMSRKAILVILMVVGLSFPALAQKITVTGTVVDETGEPLIGASVMAQGTTTGVATDFDGNYRLDVDANGVLVVSYVGYNTQEVPVQGRHNIDITMSENSVMLGEVVAIGYGTVKKSDATGSVAVIKPDDIEAGLATSTQDLLVGAAPGVTVTTDGGNPTGNATIRIRGGSSLSANNNPLIVIDGVPMSDQGTAGGTNAMTMVNPNDIESLTVLKDASATAIYGSRASNGVIIITTKKGQSGKPKVTFAANWHMNTPRKTWDVMNAGQFTDLINNVGLGDAGTTAAAQALLGDADTDWQKELFRTSFSQDYSLSVAGQAGFLPYRVNASWTDSEGIMKNSWMQRTTAGISLTPKFFNGLLQINANANGSYLRGRQSNTDAIGSALAFNPTLPVRTDYPTIGDTGLFMYNGYTQNLVGGVYNTNTAKNPVSLNEDERSTSEVWSSTGNLQIDYAFHFLPDLHANLNLGYQVSNNTSWSTCNANSVQRWAAGACYAGDVNNIYGAGTWYRWHEIQRNTLLDFYLNYKKNIESIKSNIDLMAGYSWQHFDYFGRSYTLLHSRGFNMVPGGDGTFTLNWDENSAAAIGERINNDNITRWAGNLQLVSFFGRLNYIYDDTYLFTFTLRDDGTSRFSKDNRWGLFPSLALAWKINNMPVFEDVRGWWNDFKLRLGWGITGQQDIGGLFPYMAIWTMGSNNSFMYPSPNGGAWINPLFPGAFDESIKWEETHTWNVGLDFGFFNNRLTIAADWYLRDTKDLLAWTPVAGLATSNYMTRNIGSLRNTGIEVTIQARPVVTNDFTWSTGFNIGYNENKITKLTGNAASDAIASTKTPGTIGTELQYHMVGDPANTYMVYQTVYDNDGNPVPGLYVDQNNDGIIDGNDRIKYHSPDPKVTMSWNNTFTYKNWDLGISLRANLGNWVYNYMKYERTRLGNVYDHGALTNLLADEYLFPAYVNNAELIVSSYMVENASFLRCDNITLGYTFDNLLNDRLNLRVFGAVQNPFVITKYKGLDPEVFGGIDNNVYPRPLTVTLGVVANF